MEQQVHVLLPPVSGLTKLDLSVPSPKVVMPAQADLPEGTFRPPGVLLAPGAGGRLSTPGLEALSEGIAEQGRICVRFDMEYRALGRRSPPAAEKSDGGFPAVLAAVSARFDLDRWVVGGRSYGGRVASILVAKTAIPAMGLLLYSYPLHRPGDTTRLRIDHWGDIGVPCLFLVGTKDPFCDLARLEDSLSLIPAPVSVLKVQGGGHGLRVPGANSPDGKPRSERAVLEEVLPQIQRWLDGSEFSEIF